MKIGRYTKLADGLRTTPVPLVQLAQATPLDARAQPIIDIINYQFHRRFFGLGSIRITYFELFKSSHNSALEGNYFLDLWIGGHFLVSHRNNY